MSTPRGRLPKQSRLLKAREFVAVLRHPGYSGHKGPLRVRAVANTLATARLGLVVGKRGNRLAVRRNRIKRLVREAFRARRATLPAADIVVQVHAEVDDARLVRDLHGLLDRLDDADL